MALFLSTYPKKIDKKGRVSVPSQFRAVLAAEPYQGLVIYSSFINDCIEACGMSRIEALSGRIEMLDPFSEEHDAFASAILAGSMQLPFDGEGRISLPEILIAELGISQEVVFAGKGKTFEIWEPRAFVAHAVKSREQAMEKRNLLRALPDSPPGGGRA